MTVINMFVDLGQTISKSFSIMVFMPHIIGFGTVLAH